MGAPASTPPVALSPEAIALGARALPLRDWARSPRRPRRVALVFDLEGVASPARAALRDLPDSSLTPFVPVDARPGGFEPREALLEAPLDALTDLVARLPALRPLLDAQAQLDRPPAPPRLMGVLNVTPDSFSDGGRFLDPRAAIEQGLRLVREGAAIVDVGGESTRPGAEPVPAAEERRRVLPVIEALAAEGVTLSIDTTKAEVARAALDAGATMVNDVSAGRADGQLLALVAARGCDLVLMHAQGAPATMQVDPRYGDPVADVARFLRARAAQALAAGVEGARLLLDPGIGFGKRLEHNLSLLRRLIELRSLGLPLLVGVSRKSFIGHLTGAEQPAEWRAASRDPSARLGGTAAALTACVLGGAELLRVHDVAVMAEALAVARELRGFVDDAGGGA